MENSGIVNDLVEKFLSYKSNTQGRSPGTISTYRQRLNTLVTFLAGRGKDLLSAQPLDLVEFAGMHLHEKGIAPRSRKPAIAAVRQFYKWLNKRGLVSEDAALQVEYPKAGRRLPFVISLRHAEALVMAPDMNTFLGCRDAAMLGILIGTGIRVSGLCRLNENDIVADRASEREIICLRVTEKGGHDRLVPLPTESYLLIRAYLGSQYLAQIDRTLPNGDRVLFVSTKNRSVPECDYYGEVRRITTSTVRRMILKYGAKANVPQKYLHPHAFRHLYGVEMAEAGVDVHARAALMGHADLASTLLYDRMSMRRMSAAVDKANPLNRIKTPVSALVDEFRQHGIV